MGKVQASLHLKMLNPVGEIKIEEKGLYSGFTKHKMSVNGAHYIYMNI